MAREIGRVERRAEGSYRIVIHWQGQRWRIGHAKIGGAWRHLETEDMARFVLGAIRAEASACGSVARAVAPHLRRPDDAALVLRWLARFLDRERARSEAGEISPRTVDELARQIAHGDFAYWQGHHVFAVQYGDLEDWTRHLAVRGTPPTMRKRLMENMRRFLGWLERRGEIDRAPATPTITIQRRAPEIITADEQRAVLAAIPWERRGVFLAMAHTLRPGEARAIDLLRYSAPDLLVQEAVKGLSAAAPIRGLKEGDWRVVAADAELEGWIAERLERATSEERLRRAGVPLFPNPRTGGRWSHHALTRAWGRACKAAGVEVALYPGTKHTTATDLVRQGVDPATLQRFLGHADRRSTDHYVVLGKGVKDTLRGKRDR